MAGLRSTRLKKGERIPIDQMLKNFNDEFGGVEPGVINRMKLLVMSQGFGRKESYGGVELHARGIEDEILHQYPVDIHHIYASNDKFFTSFTEKEGKGRIIHHPIYQHESSLGFFSPKVLKEFRDETRRLIHEEGVNMIHIRSPHTPAGNTVANVASQEGVASVMTFHQSRRKLSLMHPTSIGMSVVQSMLIPSTKKFVGYSFGISNATLLTLGENAFYMGNGIDTEQFNPDKIDDREFKEKFPQVEGKRVILMPGRITFIKGQMVLLDAYDKLPEDLKNDTILVFAGRIFKRGPSYADKVKERIDQLGGNAIMTGNLSQDMLAKAYKAAEFVVVPSLEEALGRVVVEGNSMKKAVIGSDIDGIPEAMDPDVTGLLVKPGDPDDLSSKIEHLLRNPDYAKSLGEQGRAYAIRNFSRKSLALRHLQVYSKMIKTDGSHV